MTWSVNSVDYAWSGKPHHRNASRRLKYDCHIGDLSSVREEAILVGRGGVDNHETTFKHAKGNDFWLHVRDAPEPM